MVEASNITVTSATKPIEKQDPRPDKNPAEGISMHCPNCMAMMWATHAHFGDGLLFLRAGTLLESEKIVPSAHFFVRSKHPWIAIPGGVPAFDTLPGSDDGPLFDAEGKARLAAAKGSG